MIDHAGDADKWKMFRKQGRFSRATRATDISMQTEQTSISVRSTVSDIRRLMILNVTRHLSRLSGQTLKSDRIILIESPI